MYCEGYAITGHAPLLQLDLLLLLLELDLTHPLLRLYCLLGEFSINLLGLD